jgi:hypothetical protein
VSAIDAVWERQGVGGPQACSPDRTVKRSSSLGDDQCVSVLIAAQAFTWFGVSDAAAYVDVSPEQMLRAVENHELPVLMPFDARGERMLRSSDLDLWSLWALGRPTQAARDAELAAAAC